MREQDGEQQEGRSTREYGIPPARGRARVRLLGPMEMLREGTALPLPGGRQRSLFAALLLSPRQVLTHDRLVELVWDERPPNDHRAALRTCAMRLRKVLPPDWRERLATHPSGYSLECGDDELDWHVFRSAHRRAAAAVHAAQWSLVQEELDAALALWRGPALVDVPSQRLRDAHLGHLEEAHAQAVEWRYEALLGLGRHQDVTGEIHQAIGRFPLRESLRAQLMLALYRGGREAEALAAYQDARTVLAAELGTDPSERLQDLHQRILVRDTSLNPPTVPPAAASAAAPSAPAAGTGRTGGPGLGASAGPSDPPEDAEPPGPAGGPAGAPAGTAAPGEAEGSVPFVPPPGPVRNVPLPSRGFVGRTAELERLDAVLHPSGTDAAVTAPDARRLVLVTGVGGIGKTSLVTHWAHTAAGGFPDGQYFIDLRGFDPVLPALSRSEALGQLLGLLHVPYERVPHAEESRLRMYHALMEDRRALVVLDNASDVEQVRALLPNAPSVVVLVTSRNQLPGLVVTECADVLPLRPMARNDTVAMLEHMLARDRVRQEGHTVGRLLALCGDMPLTTCIVGAQAALTPELSLAGLCERMESEPNVLDRFETGDPTSSIRWMLDGSYARLGPAAARAYGSLGVHRGSPVSLGSLAAMTGSSLPDTRKALNELVRSSLLTISADGLYRMHDLVRAHAVELAQSTAPAEERTEARRRLFDYLLRCAFEAACRIDPFGACTALPVLDGSAPGQPAPDLPGASNSPAQAAEWFSVHGHTLLNTLENCREDGTVDRAWMLLECMSVYLSREGRWEALATAAARLLDTVTAVAPGGDGAPSVPGAASASDAAGVHGPDAPLGTPGPDGRHLRGMAAVGLQLGSARERLGDPDALRHLTTALALFERSADDGGRARTYLALARYHGRRKEAGDFRRYATLAAQAFQESGDTNGYAESLNSLGWHGLEAGRVEHSITACEQALRIFQEQGNIYGQADTWDTLAHAHQLREDVGLSLHCYENAITLDRRLDRCGHRINQADTLLRYGDLSAASGRHEQAVSAWTSAADLLSGVAHPLADEAHRRLRLEASPGAAVPAPDPSPAGDAECAQNAECAQSAEGAEGAEKGEDAVDAQGMEGVPR